MGEKWFEAETALPELRCETLLRQAGHLASGSGMTVRMEQTSDVNFCLILEGALFVAADSATRSAFQQLLVHAQQFDVMSNGDMVRMTFYYDL